MYVLYAAFLLMEHLNVYILMEQLGVYIPMEQHSVHILMEQLSCLILLSYDFASGNEIKPCNKIDKPLGVYGERYDVHNNVAYIMTKLYRFCLQQK